MLSYLKTNVIPINKLEHQATLNEGKGLVLCHIRKVIYEAEEIRLTMKRKYQEISSSNDDIVPMSKEIIDKPISTFINEYEAKYYTGKYNGEFTNSKRLMSIIEKHINISYSKLYVMLFANTP